MCMWMNQYHECVIVDEKKLGDDTSYYVHYVDLDRRLDKWIDVKEIRDLPATAMSTLSPSNSPRRLTRRDKRKLGGSSSLLGADPESEALEKEHEERTKVKNIESVQCGAYVIEAWYFSPFPEPYRNASKLYICEFCLKYMRKLKTLEKHKGECKLRHPPGDEIYRDRHISVFEVDGSKHKIYCQCLCLLAKLFIDHKTLYYDVEPFLFYIVCESDKDGYHVVGYFSKEKDSSEQHNVACILTFPQHQRKGYGKFLIEFSYQLSKLEGKAGSPEKPLSDLGKVSYRSYWTRTLLSVLDGAERSLAIQDVSALTAIKPDDIIDTLQFLGLIRYVKGQHVISVTPKLIEQHMKAQKGKVKVFVDQTKIKWEPKQYGPDGREKKKRQKT